MVEEHVEATRQRIAQLFEEQPLWSPPSAIASYVDPIPREEEDALVESANVILDLLEANPFLASQKFHHPALVGFVDDNNYSIEEGCYPLTFFVWKNLSTTLLDRVYRLYPQAISEPQLRSVPNLLELECRLFFASDATLRWLISNTEEVEESAVFRIILFRNILPVEVVKDMLDKALYPAFQDNGTSNQLVNVLLARGYGEEVLEVVLDRLKEGGCDMMILNTEAISWELDSNRAKVIANLFPKMEIIRLESLLWTLEGWKSVLSSLTQCPTIRALHLQLPFSVVLEDPQALEALQSFLSQRASYTGHLSLLLTGDVRYPLPPNYNHSRSQRKTRQVLQTILNGLEANPQLGPTINGLEFRYLIIPSQILARLERYVASFCLQEAGILADGSSGMQQGKQNSSTEGHKTKIWDALATLHPRLGDYAIERHFGVQSVSTKVSTSESLHIRVLWPGTRRRLDINDMLVTLVEYAPLRELVLNLPRHSCNVQQICQVLRENVSLRKLSLRRIKLCHEDYNAVPGCFLRVLQERNVTLQDLTIFNHHYKAITLRAALNQRHVDVRCAEQIKCLLRLNKFGRNEFQKETTSLERVVALLDEVQKPKSYIERLYFSNTCTLEELQLSEEELTYDSLAQSTTLYEKLRKSVTRWCKSRREGAEKQSILFGLLREYPDLWCHAPSTTST